MNGINGAVGGASATATATATGGRGSSDSGSGSGTRVNLEAENKAIEKQTQILAANKKAMEDAGGQYLKLDRMLRQYDETLEEVGVDLQSEIDLKEKEVEDTKNQVGTNSQLYAKQKKELDGLIDKRTQLTQSLNEQEAAIKKEMETIDLSTTTRTEAINIIQQQRDSVQDLYDQLVKNGQASSTRAQAYKKEIDLLNQQEESLRASTRAFKGLGSTLKQAFNFVWINLVVAAIVAAGTALIKYISNLRTAAKAQAQFVKEMKETKKALSQNTNQIISKQVVLLKELAIEYRKVGDSAEAKAKFLKDYADKIKETGINITGVNKADDVFIGNTSKYVEALMKRARAQAAENVAVKKFEEGLNRLYDIDTEISETYRAIMERGNEQSPRRTDLPDVNEAYENLEDQIEYQEGELRRKLKKLQDERQTYVDNLDKQLRYIFTGIGDPKEYEGLLNGTNQADDDAAKAAAEAEAKAKAAKEAAEALKDTMRQDLETLKKANEDALRVLMDERTRELQDVAKHYDELIELAKKYNQDTTLLELARQREIQDIIDKYEKERREKEYDDIQTEIEQIRRMYDTSNLREPTEQRYQTTYQQPPITRALGLVGLATGTN